MTQHINDKPLNLTGNGATHVEGTYPVDGSWNKDGVRIFNPDTTQVCFVKSGASTVVADTTSNFVPPNSSKLFRKLPTDTTLSIVFPGASVVVVRAVAESGFEGIQ